MRKSKGAPCRKKGKDNAIRRNSCECLEVCRFLGKGLEKKEEDQPKKKEGAYIDAKSPAVERYREQNPESGFNGCTEVEQCLINWELLRYEAREPSGLEVLFKGIVKGTPDSGLDRIQGLTADHFNADTIEDFGSDEISLGETIFAHSHNENNHNPTLYDDRGESVPNFFDKIENITSEGHEGEEEGDRARENMFIDEDMIAALSSLGYGRSLAHELFSAAPDDLDEVVFNDLHRRGIFEQYDEDLVKAATCMAQKRDLRKDILPIWPRYTKRRFESKKRIIKKIIDERGPFWAKRFSLIWAKLTPAQIEAVKCEFFHGEQEKPSKLESAAKLGISVSSYQERLEWAYKKIAKLYPEFERVRRRRSKQKKAA
ncbi:MAG: hypothetical protein OXB88_04160 [Bacteriovoracales bacterium]|nr:hypothetical protein [Bacteriovoracales bacterium]